MSEFDFQNLELELFTIDELQLYKLSIPHPPQLAEALGYFGMNKKIGVWRDNVEDRKELLANLPEVELKLYPVSKTVNRPKNNSLECIKPI